ncbi:MAG TPA: secretin N-terminal domain-containing protein [Thermoanaerobaculia bacterium]
MNLKRTLLMISMMAALSGAAIAEPPAAPAAADTKAPLAVRSFTFKFKQADKAAAAIKPLLSADGSMSIQPSTNSLVVTDRTENMKAVAKMIGDFDKEPQSFRLYVRIVGASRVDGTPKIADDLKEVARKLAILLPYNSFESVGEATVQGKEGDPGLIDMRTGYRADFRFGEYDAASDSIAVKDLQISRLTGAQKDQLTSLLKTTLNLTIGQTYILGASKAPQSQRALMIVLVARR